MTPGRRIRYAVRVVAALALVGCVIADLALDLSSHPAWGAIVYGVLGLNAIWELYGIARDYVRRHRTQPA
jgi:uncharacterized membrane protein YuzA (DUF378 family)